MNRRSFIGLASAAVVGLAVGDVHGVVEAQVPWPRIMVRAGDSIQIFGRWVNSGTPFAWYTQAQEDLDDAVLTVPALWFERVKIERINILAGPRWKVMQPEFVVRIQSD